MSRNTKSRSVDKNMRRSALSFVGVNGSLDVDHVLQTDPWKDVEKFEKSEAACLLNMLNDFDDKIIQEKALKEGHTTAKKSPRTRHKSLTDTKKSPMKSPIKDSTIDLPGTSSNTNSNVVETKTTVNKKKRASTKSRQTSKTVEETIPQEFPCDIYNVKKETQTFSKSSAEENVDSFKQIIEKEILQDITNITEENLQTSTPKKEIPKITKKSTKKRKSTAENKTPKMKDSENKSKRDVQCKERQKISKKDTKDKQDIANMLGGEEKTNVGLKNNLECYKVYREMSKDKIEDKKEQCCATLLSQMEKKCEVEEINNNVEKSAKSKKCSRSMPNQLKRKKLRKENPDNKLQKSAQSNKSSRINSIKNIKCQCRKSCAKYSYQCSKEKEDAKKMKQHKKSIKAARAIEDLSRRITIVKKKMKCIKNDLENNESSDSDSSYTDESSYSSQSSYSTYSSSSYSSDSCSSYSCTSTCSCSYCYSDDHTEWIFNSCNSSNSSDSSGNSKENNSQTENTSGKEDSH